MTPQRAPEAKPDAMLANRRLNERLAVSVNFVALTALMGVGGHLDHPDMRGLNAAAGLCGVPGMSGVGRSWQRATACRWENVPGRKAGSTFPTKQPPVC
jgi:hypothetical protein